MKIEVIKEGSVKYKEKTMRVILVFKLKVTKTMAVILFMKKSRSVQVKQLESPKNNSSEES